MGMLQLGALLLRQFTVRLGRCSAHSSMVTAYVYFTSSSCFSSRQLSFWSDENRHRGCATPTCEKRCPATRNVRRPVPADRTRSVGLIAHRLFQEWPGPPHRRTPWSWLWLCTRARSPGAPPLPPPMWHRTLLPRPGQRRPPRYRLRTPRCEPKRRRPALPDREHDRVYRPDDQFRRRPQGTSRPFRPVEAKQHR